MKNLLLHLLLVSFYSLAMQKIVINKAKGACPDFKNTLYHLNESGSISEDAYGFNSQNCGLRNPSNNESCCYISVYHKDEWFDFCGIVPINLSKSKNFIDGFINFTNLTKKERDIYGNNEKNLKIDCFSKKYKFMESLGIIILILLF